MSNEKPAWITLSRELLVDLVDLLQAEVDDARRELSATGKRALWVAAFFGLALFVLFWVLALGAYVLVEVAGLWLDPWAAALVVTGLYSLVAAVLAAIGVSRARRLSNPIDVVLRRLHEHLEWWREEVALHPAAELPPGEEGDEQRRTP